MPDIALMRRILLYWKTIAMVWRDLDRCTRAGWVSVELMVMRPETTTTSIYKAQAGLITTKDLETNKLGHAAVVPHMFHHTQRGCSEGLEGFLVRQNTRHNTALGQLTYA
jgi:hypothetical protein